MLKDTHQWLLLLTAILIIGLLGAAVDRFVLGTVRPETNEKFRYVSLTVILLGMAIMLVAMLGDTWFGPTEQALLLPYHSTSSVPHGIKIIDLLIYMVVVVFPFAATRRINDKKTRRWFLAGCMAIFFGLPAWLVFLRPLWIG